MHQLTFPFYPDDVQILEDNILWNYRVALRDALHTFSLPAVQALFITELHHYIESVFKVRMIPLIQPKGALK